MNRSPRRAHLRRWVPRIVLLVLLWAAADVALTWLDFAPDHVRFGLVVLLASVMFWLVVDSLGRTHTAWDDDPVRPMIPPGGDPGLASYVRMIEGHLTASAPDSAVRDRLAALCDERLLRTHHLTRQDPGAEDLLGADLMRDLGGPVRRLSRTEIARHLERIEKL